MSARRESTVLRVAYLGRVEYSVALALQEKLLGEKIGGDPVDDLLLLEHPPVYTLGRGADEGELLGAPERLGVSVHRVGRGGGATFHGPGQLVAYPVVRLRPRSRDVHRYIRALERVLVETCAVLGVGASAREGQTGIWVGEHKIGSIGIGVRRGIAYHGTALNVDVDTSYFGSIVVCRSPQARVTSIREHTGNVPDISSVASIYTAAFTAVMGYDVDCVVPGGGLPAGASWNGAPDGPGGGPPA